MDMKKLVEKNRSYRRFCQEHRVPQSQLENLVDLARLTASGGNKQYIRYICVSSEDGCASVYGCLGWAAYLSDWDGPEAGERPSAYIVLLRDLAVNQSMTVDEGIAGQTILLGASEAGLGGCMLMNVDRSRLAEFLSLDTERYNISMVIALGMPKEEVKLVETGADGDIRYYRDAQGVHIVPKRPLHEVILKTL